MGRKSSEGQGSRPVAGSPHWWRRGDSTSAAFAAGWTMPSSLKTAIGLEGCGACYAATASRHPSARSEAQRFFSGSMSLYRAGLKLAFFLPLGVTMPLSLTAPSGFTDVSSVLSRSSRIGATLDRTPVRKHSASGLYARSCLFVFSLRATRAAGKTLGQQRCLLTLHPVARCRAIL
jgi:hypothetical protein